MKITSRLRKLYCSLLVDRFSSLAVDSLLQTTIGSQLLDIILYPVQIESLSVWIIDGFVAY